MKLSRELWRMAIGFAALCGCCGCTGPKKSGTSAPQIWLTGTSGASVTGYYILNGKRTELAGVLPLTLTNSGISQVAVRKVNQKDNLEVAVRTTDGFTGSSVPPGFGDGLRLQVKGGMSVSKIAPEESLDPPGNALMTISPYWHQGTWVFDDAKAGLVREPFVAGVPEMMNLLVQDIPSAREGFRLTFSARPFPGFQKKLRWVRAESGGNYYRLSDPPMEGWLCPAMFKYFTQTPKELYVKAEPISR